jgi:hypothetical protein
VLRMQSISPLGHACIGAVTLECRLCRIADPQIEETDISTLA